jgi:hypothetical protein
MCKKYFIYFLITSLLIQLCSCYSTNEISKDEIARLKGKGDIIVYTKDSTIYSFKESHYHISNDSLYGKGFVKFNEDDEFKVSTEGVIALNNIQAIERSELNASHTTWLIIGSIFFVAALIVFIVIANRLSDI